MEYGTQNSILGIKAEAVAGTFLAPTAPDFDIVFYELGMLEWDNNFNRQGKPADGSGNQAQSHSAKTTGSFAGKTILLYSGDETVAPAVGKVLIAGGLYETGGATVPIVYNYDGTLPCGTLSGIRSDLTCGTSPSSIDKKARGMVPDLVFTWGGVGQEVTIDCAFSCGWGGETDNAGPIKVVTSPDGAGEKLEDPLFTYGGVTYRISKATLALGATIAMVEDPDDFANKRGVHKYKITSFDPKFTVTVEKVDLATANNVSDAQADTVFNPITLTGQHWDLEITDANLLNPKDEDGEGTLMETNEFEVRAFTLTQKDS